VGPDDRPDEHGRQRLRREVRPPAQAQPVPPAAEDQGPAGGREQGRLGGAAGRAEGDRGRADRKEYSLARQVDLVGQGLCGSCRLPRGGKSAWLCDDCHTKKMSQRRQKIADRAATGTCTQCGSLPAMPGTARSKGPSCETCYLKKKAKDRLGSCRHAAAIKAVLEAQNWRCALSGELIVLGVNDALDHILPVQRFPNRRKDPGNVQWTTREVNYMKLHRTPGEFLGLLTTIISHCKGHPEPRARI
jgi:hypothetical protein